MIESSLKKNLLPNIVEQYPKTIDEDDCDVEYKNPLPHIQKLLGCTLYWLGVPIQILVLTRKSNFSQSIWLPPFATIVILLLGLILTCCCLQLLKQLTQRRLFSLKLTKLLKDFYPHNHSECGSFFLASILGSTGFLGIAIVPMFVSQDYFAWVVLYSVTHNLLGSYGLGVLLASYFGRSQTRTNRWQTTQQDVVVNPAFWALILGFGTYSVHFPQLLDTLLQVFACLVVPGAFLLIGMQLFQLRSIKQNLQSAIIPSTIKIFLIPGLVGLVTTLIGISHDGRLVLVLMSGMPTAVVNSIVAEQYNLNRSLTTSSVVLSTIFLPLTIFFWLYLFKWHC